MKVRKVVSGATVVALALAGVLMSGGMASAEEVAPLGQPDIICTEGGDGWQDKVDTTGDPATVEVTAPAGFLIDGYCVKAGSGDDAKHIIWIEPTAVAVIDHPIKDSVSHFQVHLIPIPDEPEVTSLNPPVVKDLCETEQDHYGLPSGSNGVTYSRDGLDIIATLADGFVVSLVPEGWVSEGEGVYRYSFQEELFSDEDCDTTTPVPALFNVQPSVADCGVAGTLNFTGGLVDHVNLSISPAYDGPGTYVISADTEAGYTFPDGTTHKEREVTVPEALVYQSTNANAPCYLAPPVTVTLANPVVLDPCGAENDEVTLPEDTEGVVYSFASDDVTNFDVRATVQDGFVVETVPAGWSGSEGVYIFAVDLTNTTCTGSTTPPGTTPASNPSTGSLAATGGGNVSPLMPLAGGLTVALGIVLMLMRRFARV
jgi:hypothetical protein